MTNGRDLGSLRACILAGGLGLRLRSIVADRPKTLAPIQGRPFLEYLLRQLAGQGIRDVTICTGYRGEEIEQFAGAGDQWQLRIGYSRETTPLGTAGALRQAIDTFDDTEFIVLNGDSVFDIPLARLLERHRQMGTSATLAVRWTSDPGRYGAVEIDGTGRIVAFREKAGAGPALMNGGVYVLTRGMLVDLAPATTISLEREVFPALVARRGRAGLGSATFDGWFIDIGVPSDYASLNRDPGPLLKSTRASSAC